MTSVTCSPGRTVRKRTARRSASSRRRNVNGPMPARIAPQQRAPRCCPASSTATTAGALTEASATPRLSADSRPWCEQRACLRHLARGPHEPPDPRARDQPEHADAPDDQRDRPEELVRLERLEPPRD